jgi:hypothetical protein
MIPDYYICHKKGDRLIKQSDRSLEETPKLIVLIVAN